MTDRLLCVGLVGMLAAFTVEIWEPLREIVVNVGENAPKFSVTADNGELISVPDFKGKALLLNFWASWCEPCIEETPSLDALARALGPEGLVVLGVSKDEEPSAYSDFIRDKRISFLTFRQPDQSIQHQYGTTRIPETYLIDRRGKVLEKFVSNQDWTSPGIVARLRALL